jgi:hypothetical protein
MSEACGTQLENIQHFLDLLEDMAANSPGTAPYICQEIVRICDRHRNSRDSPPQHFPPPAFNGDTPIPDDAVDTAKYRNTRAYKELQSFFGGNMPVREVRRLADGIGKKLGITLTHDVRNHINKLMSWFDANWDRIGPSLRT